VPSQPGNFVQSGVLQAALAHIVTCCTAAFVQQSQVQRTRKRQDEPERRAVRSSALSPNGQKAGDFHRYNYRMDVAADLDREAWYAFGNRVSLTTGNTSTAWAANFFSIPPLTSNPGTTATTSISYDDNGNVTVACLTRIEEFGRGCAHGNWSRGACGLDATCITDFDRGEASGARG
jgi:hypothetical protein